jgi:hypothetical protein
MGFKNIVENLKFLNGKTLLELNLNDLKENGINDEFIANNLLYSIKELPKKKLSDCGKI